MYSVASTSVKRICLGPRQRLQRAFEDFRRGFRDRRTEVLKGTSAEYASIARGLADPYGRICFSLFCFFSFSCQTIQKQSKPVRRKAALNSRAGRECLGPRT